MIMPENVNVTEAGADVNLQNPTQAGSAAQASEKFYSENDFNTLKKESIERRQTIKQMEATLNERDSKLSKYEKEILPEYESLKQYKDKYLAMETKQREQLLSQIPEDKRDVYKDWDLDKLNAIIDLFSNKTPATDIGALNTTNSRAFNETDLTNVTYAEIYAHAAGNQAEYTRLIALKTKQELLRKR